MSDGLHPSPGMELAAGVFVPPGEMRWQFGRSSGPGGQNVNKVNTKAELWIVIHSLRGLRHGALERLRAMAGHRLTAADELHFSSDEHRSQEANRGEVLQRLRELLTKALHEPKRRKKTRPTRASKERRLTEKKNRSGVKHHRRGGFEE